jgi:hypothetical protein
MVARSIFLGRILPRGGGELSARVVDAREMDEYEMGDATSAFQQQVGSEKVLEHKLDCM